MFILQNFTALHELQTVHGFSENKTTSHKQKNIMEKRRLGLVNEWQNLVLTFAIILVLTLTMMLLFVAILFVLSAWTQEFNTSPSSSNVYVAEKPSEAPSLYMNITITNPENTKTTERLMPNGNADNAENAVRFTTFDCTAKQLLRCSPQGCECK
jgi:hypothetical protein